jgi:probable DNA repair protein
VTQTLDFAGTLDALSSGATVVTANNRLARHLAGRYADARLALGQSVWETPDVLPLGAWLNRCHKQLSEAGHSDRRLLTPHQNLLAWERQVRESTAGADLLRPDAAAALAAEAWERLCAWNLGLDGVDGAAGEESRAFLQWARAFLRECESHGWLDAPRLPAVVSGALRSGALPPPSGMIFAGFETPTPALEKLAVDLAAAGCEARHYQPPASGNNGCRIRLQDAGRELAAAASWAAGRLAAKPAARLAIVIPDLGERRSEAARILDSLLHPEAALLPKDPPARQYDLSLGSPLLETPLVNDALLALRLLTHGLDFADLSTLLRSPFLGGGESDYLAHCALEASFREWPERRIQAHGLRRAAKQPCPGLARRLEKAERALKTRPASPATWSSRFRDALSAMGWPGERALDSHEYQQTQRFRDLVDELPSLETVSPMMDAQLALGSLAAMARRTTFQPAGNAAPAIQVMGLLEADGQTFDGLWISGLSDQQYPPAAEPHPLLPIPLQRRHGMPRASAERELAFAERLLSRLLSAAPEVIVSWPHADGDRELLPTPLIQALPEAPFDALGTPWLEPVSDTLLGAQALVVTEDARGNPLPPDSRVRGGTRLLLDQADCPFRAYAHHRLHAAGFDDPTPGPSPQTRGNLIHAALEAFWRTVGTREAMLGCDAPTLARHIEDAVEHALDQAGRDLRGESRNLERRRLCQRLDAWLELERRRAPFTVIATEERCEVSVGALSISTLADRVDRLDDGRLVVIDYKSGGARRNGWFGERLFEPQLPLYATSRDDAPVAAVSFASLRPDAMRFIGTAEEDGLLPGVTSVDRDRQRGDISDWPGLLQHWDRQLWDLAAEIEAGLASVSPQRADACTWCDLDDLCRIARTSDDLPSPDGGPDA